MIGAGYTEKEADAVRDAVTQAMLFDYSKCNTSTAEQQASRLISRLADEGWVISKCQTDGPA